jgi:glycosyltransferase involved in cell wall biosynthesis
MTAQTGRALFVHNNFPAQYVHLAPAMKTKGWDVRALGSKTARSNSDIPLTHYQVKRGTTKDIHPHVVRYEADCLRGEAAAHAALQMKRAGFTPDIIVGHLGWGETQFLVDVWPDARQLIYAEFFVGPYGLDVGFDPEFPAIDLDRAMKVRAKNASIALVMSQCDAAMAPTQFQAGTFPQVFRDKIRVIHDGIDTANVIPRPGARLAIPGADLVFKPGDKIVTNLNRHLEPLRGIHQLLRAAPLILDAHPDAHIVIVGGAGGAPYGYSPPPGKTWADVYLEKLGDTIDRTRVHFLGRVDRETFLNVIAVSAAHVYLTYPFVLSWSLIEAMSAECFIVASDTAPVREVIEDGRNGRLVDFFSPQALAEAVNEGLARPHAHTALRRQARADAVARFDLQTKCLPAMVRYVEEVAAR